MLHRTGKAIVRFFAPTPRDLGMSGATPAEIAAGMTRVEMPDSRLPKKFAEDFSRIRHGGVKQK
jgi:hypothetical protein